MRELLLATLMVLTSGVAWATSPSSKLAESCSTVVHARGFMAPDGTKVALADYAAGRPLAVVVIKGHWCPACTDQLRTLSKKLKQVRATGGDVIALSTEDAGTNEMIMRKHALRFPVLGEPSAALLERLGFWWPEMGHPTPGLIFLDRCGDVTRRVFGRRPGWSQDEIIIDVLRELAKQPATCGFDA